MNKDIVSIFDKELDKLTEKENKKLEKYKRKEQKKEAKRLKKLEKAEDKGFARMQKISKVKDLYISNQEVIDSILPLVYKICIGALILFELIYFIASFFRNKILPFNNILFLFIVSGFLLTSTIQKKNARKLVSIVTCFLIILWIILHI